MTQSGTLLVRVFLSDAQIPIPGAIVVISRPESSGKQKLLSIQLTDQSGVTPPVVLNAPDPASSLTPGNNGSAYSNYTLVVEHPDYQLAVFDNLQVFPNVETIQDVPLIPLSPNGRVEDNTVTVTPQPL